MVARAAIPDLQRPGLLGEAEDGYAAAIRRRRRRGGMALGRMARPRLDTRPRKPSGASSIGGMGLGALSAPPAAIADGAGSGDAPEVKRGGHITAAARRAL